MIYPQKMTSKKRNKIIRILLLCSVILALILEVINKLKTPNIPWAPIANIGIIYIWVTVISAIKRTSNIASNVLLQMIAIFILIFYIDRKIGFSGWSIYIGMPIIIIIANVTMLILEIACYRNYIKYALYQLIIVFLSLVQIIFVSNGIMSFEILNKISIGVSLFNFIMSLILSYKEFYKILVCKFHM